MQATKKRQVGHQNDRVEQICSKLTPHQRCVRRCNVAQPLLRWESGA
ncbi:MAG: hypothetical protein KME45_27630 [Stenomitos rutilans HA7619-LM2]|nr:hypothetical protein [Stenomitos rutilans HA7619-LM2]